MAIKGKKVFVYAIAPFITYRVMEMIRVDLCGMNLPVTLVGVGAGFSYDDSGPTHHAVEDIGILRSLPNIKIHNITDSVMAGAFAKISVGLKYPNYIRMDRQDKFGVYNETMKFSSGFSITDASAGDVDIVTTGSMIYTGYDIAERLGNEGWAVRNTDVYEFPIPRSFFERIAKNPPKRIITIEEHSLPCGLGSAILEGLSDRGLLIPVKRFGLDLSGGYCYQYGGREAILETCGIDRETIKEAALKWMSS
jgi:transketolase